jgi:hypothetical protein
MKNENITFFIHVDKKSNIGKDIIEREDIIVLPDDYRVDVQWAAFSQIEATLSMLKYATAYGKYDFFMLVSGQDFPIKSPEDIIGFLKGKDDLNFINLFKSRNNGLNHGSNYDKRNEIVYNERILRRDLITRLVRRGYVVLTGGYNYTFKIFKRKAPQGIKFFFGSQWWCLSGKMVDWILAYLKKDNEYIEFFKKSSCADESFFQTLVMNSPYADDREDYLHYIDWSLGGSNPKTLTGEDYDEIIASGKLMTRKIDGDKELIDKLITKISL